MLMLAYGNVLDLEKLFLGKDGYPMVVSIVESGCEAGLTTVSFFSPPRNGKRSLPTQLQSDRKPWCALFPSLLLQGPSLLALQFFLLFMKTLA